MVKKATYGSVRRLGSRYGRTVRFKLGKIEADQRKKHKCPYCNYVQVKRKAVGIWHCSKCGADFTSKAYNVEKASTGIQAEDTSNSSMQEAAQEPEQ